MNLKNLTFFSDVIWPSLEILEAGGWHQSHHEEHT